MTDPGARNIVNNTTEFLSQFLADSHSSYIMSVSASEDPKEQKQMAKENMAGLIKGMLYPKELFDEEYKPIAGTKQRENQQEMNEFAEKLVNQLDTYVVAMDTILKVEAGKIKDTKEFKDEIDKNPNYGAEEIGFRALQNAATNSIFSKTSKALSENKNIDANFPFLKTVSQMFNKMGLTSISDSIDKFIEKKHYKKMGLKKDTLNISGPDSTPIVSQNGKGSQKTL